MCVQSFPVADVCDWLWVWPGDPSLADPSLIPDLETMGFGAPGFYSNVGPMLSVNANYLLTFENFLDASHISFLHDGKIDTGEVALKKPRVSQTKSRILVTREMIDELQSPMVVHTFGFREGTVANRTKIGRASC